MSLIKKKIDEDGVAWITLNRAKAKNALNWEMIDEFVEALEEADLNPQVRTIVINSSGDAFCAGGDIKDMREQKGMFAGDPIELRKLYQRGIQRIPKFFQNCEKLTIAVVNGAAIGAGFDLSLMCDFRLVGSRAKFAESFGHLGLVSGDGGAFFLVRLVGMAKALEISLTGRVYSGEEINQLGLATRYFREIEELERGIVDFITQIHQIPAETSYLIKRSLYQTEGASLNQHLEYISTLQSVSQRGHDHLEKLRGLNKRSPNG
jgi:enoyl-CoA hydratase/carnithine racemase